MKAKLKHTIFDCIVYDKNINEVLNFLETDEDDPYKAFCINKTNEIIMGYPSWAPQGKKSYTIHNGDYVIKHTQEPEQFEILTEKEFNAKYDIMHLHGANSMNNTGIQKALIKPRVVEFIVPDNCDDETIKEFTNGKMNKDYFKKYTETADPLTHVVKLNDGSFEILNEQQFMKKYRHTVYVSPSIYNMLMYYQELYTNYQDYYIKENDIDNISKYTQAISIIMQMIECNHMLHELVNED